MKLQRPKDIPRKNWRQLTKKEKDAVNQIDKVGGLENLRKIINAN